MTFSEGKTTTQKRGVSHGADRGQGPHTLQERPPFCASQVPVNLHFVPVRYR